MKNIITLLTAGTLTFVSSYGVTLVDETFAHPDGNLVGQTPTPGPGGEWAAHSGTASFIQVSSGQAVITHGSGSREDANTSFAEQTTGVFYYGFDFSVSDDTPFTGTDGEYFAHFNTGSFVGRASIEARTGSGDFTIGIATFSSSPDSTWASDLSYNTTYRLVVGYDIDADQATLWLDPSSIIDTNILGVDGTSSTNLSEFALRQSDSSHDESIFVDNLIVSDDFNTAAAIPEPSTYAAIAGVLLLGFAWMRRRK